MTDTAPNKTTFVNRRDIKAMATLLAPVAFLVAAGTYFHTFVVNAVEANMAINSGIIGTATFGVVLIIRRMLEAQSDFRTVQRFGNEANQGVYMKALLEEPWLKGTYVSHYLSHIANTGGTLSSQMEQSAIENELHALEADYNSRLELPQFLVGFMIAMGLLGTFIGLLETLTGISGMLDGMSSGGDMQKEFMKLVTELRKPLAGMGIAFSASMFGLITSLMLAIMMTMLRRYISRVLSLARNVMHDLTQMAHGAKEQGGGRSYSPSEIDMLMAAQEQPQTVPRTVVAAYSGSSPTDVSPEALGHLDVLIKLNENILDVLKTVVDGNQETNSHLKSVIDGHGETNRHLRDIATEIVKIEECNTAVLDGVRASGEVAAQMLRKRIG